MGTEFHKNLRQAFLEIEKKDPFRCVVIDATGTADEINAKIITVVQKRLLDIKQHE